MKGRLLVVLTIAVMGAGITRETLKYGDIVVVAAAR
jgi:hypothetical protein